MHWVKYVRPGFPRHAFLGPELEDGRYVLSQRTISVRAGIVCLVIFGAMVAFTSGAQAGGYKDCGRLGPGIDGSVMADNVSCRRARGVIDGFFRKSQVYGPIVTVKGFACRGKSTRLFDVRCNKGAGRQRVHYHGSL